MSANGSDTPTPPSAKASEFSPECLRQLEVFKRGSVDLIEEKQLAQMIEQSLASGKPLRIKFGMDPTSADLHIGHGVQLMKLRAIQDLGHQIVLIVGDATAMVGDPSGRSKLRPQLTRGDVEANLKTYTDQAGLMLDLERTEIRRNSEWFESMNFFGVLELAQRMTVAQMIERDNFQQRMKDSEPIGVHEFLYPLVQGWDSVQIDCDFELGGTDQLFNLLAGRRLQQQEGSRPQICMTLPLINGLDGRKMSKSYGNAIGLTESARDMVFKIMRIDDEVMGAWFELLTGVATSEVETLLAGHPREAKARLGAEIAGFFHGAEAAAEAGAAFDREVRDKALPDDIPKIPWPSSEVSLPLPNLLRELGLASSTSEARRLVTQGGVRMSGEVIKDPKAIIEPPMEAVHVQVGKKRHAMLLPKQ